MLIEEIIGEKLLNKGLTISTAESCTGGLLSSMLTDVSGSSAYVSYNVVTYANEVKNKVLGVSHHILATYGAVSRECAEAMVLGLKTISDADVCIVTTGIAGPGGGTPEKPVGLCYVGILYENSLSIHELKMQSTTPRREMKKLFAQKALELLNEKL